VTASVTAGDDGNESAENIIDRTGGGSPEARLVAEWAAERGWLASAAGFAVEGIDVITAVSGVCPAKTITVKGVPVLLNAATTYTAPASCASLAVNQSVKVSAMIDVDAAGGFTVTATNIALASAAPVEKEVTGVVVSSTGLCPSLTINLGAAGFVVTSATTVFSPLNSCGTIAAGKTVKAKGTPDATGQLVASQVSIVDSTAPVASKLQGIVANAAGICPSLTITLQASTDSIVTNNATVFDPAGSCAQIIAGAKVVATGARNAAGQFVATKVQVGADDGDDDDDGGPIGPGNRPKASGEGVIGAVTGSCPTLTLVIQGYRVRTNLATLYVGGSCASLRPGTQVKADVEQLADGSFVAEKLEIRKIPGRQISGDGTVDAVSGTCPAITMTVQGYPVVADAQTVFSGGLCSSIAKGTRIDVTGEFDGAQVLAAAVKIVSNDSDSGKGNGNGNGNGNGKKK
jgi:hypothetical protein